MLCGSRQRNRPRKEVTENEAVLALHRLLDRRLLLFNFNDRMTSAIPDCWYGSHDGGAVWVEYKLIEAPPRRWATPDLTALQEDNLKSLYQRGHDALCIVMTKQGPWAPVEMPPYRTPLKKEQFRGTRRTLAAYLLDRLGASRLPPHRKTGT